MQTHPSSGGQYVIYTHWSVTVWLARVAATGGFEVEEVRVQPSSTRVSSLQGAPRGSGKHNTECMFYYGPDDPKVVINK